MSRHRSSLLMRALLVTAVGAAALSGVVASTPPVHAEVILHEFIGDDPEEDLVLGATTPSGTMPGAIETQSGAVGAPDPFTTGDGGTVYGLARTAQADRYRIDHDTSRPDSVAYSDPFAPSVAPFKREFAYDSVDDAFDLRVFDPSERTLEVGGSPGRQDDQFYADLRVDLSAGNAIRIPSVGPGARVIAAELRPEHPFSLLADGADNWFVDSPRAGKHRLVLHLAIDRRAFGGGFVDTDWSALSRFVPPLGEPVRRAALEVAAEIGVEDEATPAAALTGLIEHFRSFAPSTEPPESRGASYYKDLALSRKGVCRHRAYAFVVTALGLGMPARFVRNEAHAWVEVRDLERWYRIDLGGAAGDVQLDEQHPSAHVPPRDPFAWPPGSDSGQAMADRARTGASGSGAPSSSVSSAATGVPAVATHSPVTQPASPAEEPEEPSAPPSSVSLSLEDGTALRGGPLFVRGEVRSDGQVCPHVRIRLSLASRTQPPTERHLAGGLVTDERGRYFGRITVDYAVAVGDYDVVASTLGGGHCGPGKSK